MAVSNTYTGKGGYTGMKQSLLDKMRTLTKKKAYLMNSVQEAPKPAGRIHYWDYDTIDLGTVGTMIKKVEGASTTAGAVSEFNQSTNYTQIIEKPYGLSDTMVATDYGGLNAPARLAYEKRKAMKVWMLEAENAFVNGTGNSGASGTEREAAGFASFGPANTAASGSGSSAITAIAGTAFQSTVDDILQAIADAGEDADTIIMSPNSKRGVDRWTAFGTRNLELTNMNGTVSTAISMYKSSFGDVKFVMDRAVPDTAIYPYVSDSLAIAYLRKPYTEEMAKVGDSTDFRVVGELTFEFRNPLGVGVITLS